MITSTASALNGCFTRISPAMMLSTPIIATSPRPSPLPAIEAITSMTPSTSRKIPMITAIVTSDGPGQKIRTTPAASVTTPNTTNSHQRLRKSFRASGMFVDTSGPPRGTGCALER